MGQSSDKDQSTKETILLATITLIKQEGLERVTLRKITSLANVNLALVNYYFGSKENLISEALKSMLSSAHDGLQILDDASLLPIERYKQFLLHQVRGLCCHPELMQQMLGKGQLSFDNQHEYLAYVKKLGMNKIKAIVEEITGERDSETIHMMILQINAAALFPVLMTSIDPQRAAVYPSMPIEQQIDLLFEHYFARYSPQRSE